MAKNACVLLILDGYGISDEKEGNSIEKANTSNMDRILNVYPNTSLYASGLKVGLPEGQMGNSEVGHLNIGTGRIVYQELTRITKSIEDGNFFDNDSLNFAVENCKKNNSDLHVMGLLSDGGVHSHIDHLKALLRFARDKGVRQTYVHGFMDGRDVSPTSGVNYVKDLLEYMEEISYGVISTLSGRYYSMDRDKRWDRVEKAYNVIVRGSGEKALDVNLIDFIKESYENGITDEFIVPTLFNNNGNLKSGDSCIFFNFRPDRARELTHAIVNKEFDGFPVENIDVVFVCMTLYDKSLEGCLVAFKPESYSNTFGEYLSNNGKTQLRIAETEKYAHVTFFFNGGVELSYDGEDRILIPSPNVKTYDLKPEMSLHELTDTLIEQIESRKYDFIVCNIANPDMVGHTGNFDAAVKAIEAVDYAIGKIESKIIEFGDSMFITADHGNAEVMVDENGGPMTAHTCNKVPFIFVSKNSHGIKLKDNGKLADIAPTILSAMGLDIPKEINGDSLLIGFNK